MPYIKKEKRALFDPYIRQIENNIHNRLEGEKNSAITYIIYKLLKDEYDNEYVDWDYKSKPLKILVDIILEYNRRVLVPHAEKKIKENGDI